MQGVGAAVTSSNLLQTVYGFEPGRAGNRSRVGNPMADVFETKQGNLFLVPVVEAQCAKIWPVIGRPELVEDPRFTTLDARIANDSACAGALKEGLVRESAKTWEDQFSAAGVAACAILTLPEVLEDAQLAHRGTIRSMSGPIGDRDLFYTDTPFKITGEETGPDHPAPLVGAHTDVILNELGCGAEEIAALRAGAVV